MKGKERTILRFVQKFKLSFPVFGERKKPERERGWRENKRIKIFTIEKM